MMVKRKGSHQQKGQNTVEYIVMFAAVTVVAMVMFAGNVRTSVPEIYSNGMKRLGDQTTVLFDAAIP